MHKKPVRKDDEKEEGGDCGDQEESPEKPAVNSLCKHFPLSTDVVVSRLKNNLVSNCDFQKIDIRNFFFLPASLPFPRDPLLLAPNRPLQPASI